MATKKMDLLVQKAALRVIDIASLRYDPSYQRDVVAKHKKIVAEFNPEALGVPLVAEREDGTLWVVDGRQRVTALGKLGKTKVRAEVFRSKGPEHEAEVFRLVNLNRTKLKPDEVFFALITAGDETAWLVKNTIEECGFRVTRGGKNKDVSPENRASQLSCVNTLVNMAKHHGADPIRFALKAVTGAWPDDPLRVKNEVMSGLYTFWLRTEGNADLERLVPRLATTTPAKMIYSAQLGVGSRGANVADVIERLYRKRNLTKK